jgi:hypothetical protein
MYKARPGVMTRFRIDELSGVDRPAQEGAIAAIMKAAGGQGDVSVEALLKAFPGIADAILEADPTYDPVAKRKFTDTKRQQLADEGKALPDGSFPIENEEDLHNAVTSLGRAKNEGKAKAHITARAKAMGMTGALPDEWGKAAKSAGAAQGGDPMDPKELRKALGLAETASDADVLAAITKNAGGGADAAKLAKRASVLEVIAKARPVDLEFAKAKKPNPADDMEPDADDAESTKTKKFVEFMSKSEATRDQIIADYAKGDETLTANGVTISKRQVGEAMFTFAKAQAAAAETNAAALKKAQEDAADAGFEKRASTEFAHVAGTLPERVAMLKGIAALPENLRKGAEAALVAAEALAKSGFSRIGKGTPPGGGEGGNGSADDELTQKAKEIQKAAGKGMTFEKAYTQACEENPALYEKDRNTRFRVVDQPN